ncbi:MAG: glycosyltransferase family 2 protein [Sandaracinaceae bacterium]|nr:glycosyltransferase family 2 protein [Sandaracinaceae bacterium]
MPHALPQISVILPIFNEVENIPPLLREIEEALQGWHFEVICVDDGSTDGSRELLRQLARKLPYLRVILFRRNCGQSAAFDAGFRHASGALIVTMDADGQNDPRDIPRLVKKLEEGYDLVSGWRKKRKDSWIRTLPSKIANALIRWITGTRVHDLGCSLKVYRKEITDEIRLYGEMHRFLVPLAELQGAKVAEMEVNHRPRVAGVSKYGLSRVFKVLLDLLTVWFLHRYQTKPIHVFGGLGFLMIAASLLLAAYVIYQKIVLGIWVHRNPLFSISAFSGLLGLQALGLGLLAEIIVRTYFESQGRVPYPVAERIGFPEPSPQRLPCAELQESSLTQEKKPWFDGCSGASPIGGQTEKGSSSEG